MAPTVKDTLRMPLDQLARHPSNDRLGDAERVAASLLLNGQYRPIVVHYATGHVLAGNHVMTASRWLADGWRPELDDDTDVQLREAVTRWADGWPDDVLVTLVDCTDAEALAILAADNHSADDSTYDPQRSLDLAEALEAAGMLAASTLLPEHLDDLRAKLEETVQEVSGIRKATSLDDAADAYEESGTRSIVIFLGAPDYIDMQDRLEELRASFGVASNTECIVRLVRDATPDHQPREAPGA